MQSRSWSSVLLLFVGVLLVVAVAPFVQAVSGPRSHLPFVARDFPTMGTCLPVGTKRDVASVVKVVDGDTIDVGLGGQTYRVRYIGVDTPEYYEPYYQEAKAFNRSLVKGASLTLIRDVSETDRYGRLLRYVIARGLFVNYELVRRGYATAATYPPDVACSDTFAGAQQDARREGLGIWSPTPTPTTTPTPAPGATPTPPSQGGVLRIAHLQYSGRDEYVEIRNDGPGAQSMTGWTLVSVVGNQHYAFPANFVLEPGRTVRVHSGPGAFERWPTDLKWTSAYIWNNSGDKAELRDATSNVVDTYCYGSGCP